MARVVHDRLSLVRFSMRSTTRSRLARLGATSVRISAAVAVATTLAGCVLFARAPETLDYSRTRSSEGGGVRGAALRGGRRGGADARQSCRGFGAISRAASSSVTGEQPVRVVCPSHSTVVESSGSREFVFSWPHPGAAGRFSEGVFLSPTAAPPRGTPSSLPSGCSRCNCFCSCAHRERTATGE